MAINATIPGGQGVKPGIVPPKVIRQEVVLDEMHRQRPYVQPAEHPRPRNRNVSLVYTKGVNLDLTV